MAARTLQNIYVVTPNQSLKIVYTSARAGNVCAEYVTDDARSQPIIRYAVAEKGSRSLEYDLDLGENENRCNSAAGVDLTQTAEKELKAIR